MNRTTELSMTHTIPSSTPAAVTYFHTALESWCSLQQIDAILITAQDAFLSEYTPLVANHRYMLSGFSGSTGDGIFLTRTLAAKINAKAQFQLFVDGRYHLQADQETLPAEVTVHKFALTGGLDDAIFGWLREHLPAGSRLSADLQRVSWNRWKALGALAAEKSFTLSALPEGGLSNALPDTQGWQTDRPIKEVSQKLTGRSLQKNLADLRAAIKNEIGHDNYVHATCMTDDAAWLLNARGYHLPQLSSMLAYTFMTKNLCVVHLPSESQNCHFELTDNTQQLKVTRGPISAALAALEEAAPKDSGGWSICFSGRAMNAALPQLLGARFASGTLRDDIHALERIRAQKTPEELDSIRRSFLRSSRAIARTLRHAKACALNQTALSETALAEKIKSEYASEGALELSFKTISGFAANGAVIHYSTPDSNKLARKGDLLLLDSGAYYEEGFATDCTRVVLFGNSPSDASDWQKEIYTLTLKSCLAGLRANFRLETPCREIDAIARGPIQSKGYDYAHGTGHGIGIHVHESGIRLSPVSQYRFTESAVVSVEPGIYLAGKGGVRIENVAIVVPEEKPQANSHGFENVVFVGYDWDLIELSLLNDEDKNDLAAYERKCRSLGTNVTDCPLL
ncbi:MAG: M24 family metallopeptidase [Proteobacteria bacterium]|nr:M24 family metallopeptidase [Pseudomonadota bacterium]